jgi:Sulfotransferase family
MSTGIDCRQPTESSDTVRQKKAGSGAAGPVLILAPPCTFSWVVCAIVGQHPELYGLPELHLFSADTVGSWLTQCSRESYDMDHGLVRAVAEICFREQSDHSVAWARGWLRRRAHFTTGFLLEVLADRLHPLVPVEKSPSIVYRPDFMRRAFDMFPGARFLHLVSHPATYCEAVTGAMRELSARQPLPPSHWLMHLASFPRREPGCLPGVPVLDPQVSWYALNRTILEFLESVPNDQVRTVRGEDLVAGSDDALAQIAAWLEVRTDPEALAEMKHPERSPFAPYGPASSPFGSDVFLLEGPLLRPEWTAPRSLEGPVAWRDDGQEFFPEVKALGRQFGYR